jgi:hypothetical protein
MAAKYPDDYAAAFWATACVGGDIDTTCAIVGGSSPPASASRASRRSGWTAAKQISPSG